jgi:hypothetical protein
VNKATRLAITKTISDIAAHHGATVEVIHDARSTTIDCVFPEVAISFDLDGLFDGGILAHWYGAKRDLVVTPAVDSVNPCHRRKATAFAPTADLFIARFTAGCELISNGGAFAAPESTT